MRKSLAPSLRGHCSIRSNNDTVSSGVKAVTVRSTENILQLIKNPVSSPSSDVVVEKSTPAEVPQKDNSNFAVSTTEKCFNIVYGKQSKKKHKTWEGDGILKINSKSISVFTEEGKSLGSLPLSKVKDIIEGARFNVGGKEIEIVEETSSVPELKRKAEEPPVTAVKRPKNSLGKIAAFAQVPSKEDRFILPEPSAEHQWSFSNGRSVSVVAVDSWIARKLRPHQRIGVCFLYECVMGFKDNSISGAILADDMGLGKTLQCIALIWTLLRQGPYGQRAVRRVLIVTPSSLTGNWAAEFDKWLGRERIIPFVVDSKNKPTDAISRDKVVIISYEMLLRHRDILGSDFDLLICDEAHRLKNAETKVSQALSELCSSMRILLTGTPIQNDLQEFFALVDFANPNCIGSYSNFKKRYEDAIVAARLPDVSDEIKELGEELAAELNQITSQFILRRTRAHLDAYLPGKREVVIFCKPSPVQCSFYNSIIDSMGDLSTGLDGAHHLGVILALRKVASSPALLWDESSNDENHNFGGKSKYSKSDVISPEYSGKLSVTTNLLQELWNTKPRERVVLVSSFTQTLDLLEEVLRRQSYPMCRLDGSTPATQRTSIVRRFNNDKSQFVFLLSAKAGGVGLNLTGASRLVLFDSDWNPATDLQAMARIWRDGQTRDVFIYRLLTTGTIDEKIFQRQLSKQTLAGGIVDAAASSTVPLSREELMDIFSPCEDIPDCLTHAILGCECDGSGVVPQPAESKKNRPCQLVRSGGSQLTGLPRMEELMGWEHHRPPLDLNLLQNLRLSGCEDIVQFLFSTSC